MSHAIARAIRDAEYARFAYAWVITRDRDHELDGNGRSEVGTAGPAAASDEALELARTEGVLFRMYDGGDIDDCSDTGTARGDDAYGLVYEGRIWVAAKEPGEELFGPLDDFGTPNFGCTEIRYQDDSGRWAAL